jgi:hypothetical protein
MKPNSTANLEEEGFSFAGFSYQYFSWIGNPLTRLFRDSKIEDALQDAGIKIYPQAYFAIVGFLFIISILVIEPIVILSGLFFLAPIPLIVLLLGYSLKLVRKIGNND